MDRSPGHPDRLVDPVDPPGGTGDHPALPRAGRLAPTRSARNNRGRARSRTGRFGEHAGPGLAARATIPASARLDARAEPSEAREMIPAPATMQRPSTTAPARARRRVRPRIVAEPSPAAWVQVGPGRFVRDEDADPSPDASEIGGSIARPPGTPARRISADDPDDDTLTLEALLKGNTNDDRAATPVAPFTARGASQVGDGVVPVQDAEVCHPAVEPEGAEYRPCGDGAEDGQALRRPCDRPTRQEFASCRKTS